MKKKDFFYLFLVFFLLVSTFLTQPAPVHAQEWHDFSADVDGDGLSNSVEESGWYNASNPAGPPYFTDPLDADSDDDGLTDGQEKLYDAHPLDDRSPGIYVEYENHLKTRQYFAKDPKSVQPWGWQQYGDHFISLDAVVVRRGATFSIGGPVNATIQVNKSLGSLTALTPVRDACTGRWRISVPPDGTVGKYEVALQEGDWSKSLNLYVIFELPTPAPDLTQAMIDTFLYDDDPDNLRDEVGVNLGTIEYTHTVKSWIPDEAGAWVTAGHGYKFELQQFEPFVFEEHVIEAINGYDNQWAATEALVQHTDKVTRFVFPSLRKSSWKVLYQQPEVGNQCSNIAGLLAAFERSAGIPARPFFVDWAHRSFDHSTEMWMTRPSDGVTAWWSARGYNVSGWEPETCVVEGVPNCRYGSKGPKSRDKWGYSPWHSGRSGIGSVVMSADENWVWDEVDGWEHEYRWASWDWDAIVRDDWFDTLFVPYWGWGWDQEPEVIGAAVSGVWPAVTSFAIAASPGSQTVAQDNPTSYTVVLGTSDGFSNRVDLSIPDLPEEIYDFSPSFCVPNCSSILTITPVATSPIGAAGTYTVTISGQSGTYGLVRETDVQLVVTDFAIDATPDSQTVEQGGLTAYTVTLESLNGFDGIVDLSVEGLPEHATADFNPGSVGPPYIDSTLTITTTPATQAGDYTLTISGQSGGLVKETTVELSVALTPDFTIDASPDLQTVEQGETTVYTVSLEALNGFDNNVKLSVEGEPANTTVFFDNSNWVPPYDDRTINIVTASDTPTGTHTLTIRGKSGSLEHQTEVQLVVNESGGASVQTTSDFSRATSSTSVASTDSQAGLTVRGVNDYGVDLDGDGYFDQLVIEIEVDATQPGIYWLQADLGVDRQAPTLMETGGLVAADVVRADLAEGTNTVQLVFEGLQISAAKVDGPYALKYLLITDVDNPTIDDFANSALGHWRSLYTTAAYRAYDFQNRGAVLSGNYSHYDLDSDGNGRSDALVVTTGINTYQPGSYAVEGSLYDGHDKFIGHATWTGTGSDVTLRFEGVAGTFGPYTLRDLDLFNSEGGSIDYIAEAYTMAPISALVGPDLVSLDIYPVGDDLTALGETITPTQIFVESLVDGNLQVLAEVEVAEAGSYNLEAWLTDANGALVIWAIGEPTTLSVGTQVLSLTFDGGAIRARGLEGPYTVIALKVLNGSANYEVLDEVDVALTTQAYTLDQFAITDAVILFEDFTENGGSQWSADPTWTISQDVYFSSSNAWYGTDANASLALASPMNFSAANRLALKFQTCQKLGDNDDTGYVEASTDGVNWDTLAIFSDDARWSAQVFDLGDYEYENAVYLRFYLESTGGASDDAWYIDDVVVAGLLDSDYDGLSDEDEVDIYGTGPNDPDSDDDGLSDGDEVITYDTDPNNPDSDRDGLSDGDEVDTYHTNPGSSDSDNDGMPDGWEVDGECLGGPDPLVSDANGDPDGDSLTNLEEYRIGTDPCNPDSDGDGIPDNEDDPPKRGIFLPIIVK